MSKAPYHRVWSFFPSATNNDKVLFSFELLSPFVGEYEGGGSLVTIDFIAATDYLGSPIYYYLCISYSGEALQYGVKICWREEKACIPEITARKGEVLQLLELLRRGAVPPSALQDIVEDWLER